MPFRCKCGQTFERIDSFQGHTSACPRFHTPPLAITTANGTPAPSGRKSSISQGTSIIINTASYSPGFGTSPNLSSSPSSPTGSYFSSSSPTLGSLNLHLSTSTPTFDFVPVLLPASLSLQSTFAGFRRRSMTASSFQAQN
ncbi:hypothetical protein BC938DRAFT_480239 [Jimgerdemannia flammicorona]|uniref:Uncharacterized protein n=1 Tax=Jimgerdemannia flammicorona TaxID=994334 RepID=A0A433QJ17_9FUNG|nr:hypothetical protein BC938DRAFT_480239 [Jimgerdemannia flammicorona]